ncbi:hypothetical protein IKA15_05405 [bacterium]|nr:hypothetical protein [bacterium]
MCYGIHGPGFCGPGDIMTSPGGFRAVTGGPSIFGCGYPPAPMGCYGHGYYTHNHCPIGRERASIITGGVLGVAGGIAACAGIGAIAKGTAIGGAIGGPIGMVIGAIGGFALGAIAGKSFARS